MILAKDFNYLLGKQDGYAQAPFNTKIGGEYEKGYKEGQKLYNEQSQPVAKGRDNDCNSRNVRSHHLPRR